MDFLSIYYYFLLISSVGVFYILPNRFRQHFLLIISAFFIASYSFFFLFIALFLGAWSYFIGIKIEKNEDEDKKIIWLRIGIVLNVLILVFFKEIGFILDLLPASESKLEVILLPIGLSYYTFQNIGYLYDIYLERIDVEKSLSSYLTYTIFFPKIIAGPIERGDQFLLQLHSLNSSSIYQNFQAGSRKILWGLFKKIVVANRLAEIINPHFDNPTHSGIPLIMTCLLYPFQIYADFSGYTDIALGSARLFGLKLMPNFNNPFYSQSITELWRKWHMSLSLWVNEYLFKPLSTFLSLNFNLKGFAIPISLIVSFTLLGLWHGTNVNFVIFGLLQSIAIIYEMRTKTIKTKWATFLPTQLRIFMFWTSTYVFYAFSCIFFKAESLSSALMFIENSFKNIPTQIELIISNKNLARYELLYLGVELPIFLTSIVLLVLMEIVHLTKDEQNEQNFYDKPLIIRWGFYYIIIFAILFCGIYDSQDFVYKQF